MRIMTEFLQHHAATIFDARDTATRPKAISRPYYAAADPESARLPAFLMLEKFSKEPAQRQTLLQHLMTLTRLTYGEIQQGSKLEKAILRAVDTDLDWQINRADTLFPFPNSRLTLENTTPVWQEIQELIALLPTGSISTAHAATEATKHRLNESILSFFERGKAGDEYTETELYTLQEVYVRYWGRTGADLFDNFFDTVDQLVQKVSLDVTGALHDVIFPAQRNIYPIEWLEKALDPKAEFTTKELNEFINKNDAAAFALLYSYTTQEVASNRMFTDSDRVLQNAVRYQAIKAAREAAAVAPSTTAEPAEFKQAFDEPAVKAPRKLFSFSQSS